MIDLATDLPLATRRRSSWMVRTIASRGFQRWAARFPLTRRIVRREGEALFDLIAGFCHSQILMALVQFEIPARLLDAPMTAQALAHACQVPPARMIVLLKSAQALNLIKRKSNDTYALTRTGAALVGVPGLAQMIRHHDVFYRDLADPVAFFRGEVDTELAQFWPYVFGGDMDPGTAAIYSDLMAQSQVLVAEDTLQVVPLNGVMRLMDVGGGSGAFLAAVGQRYPDVALSLFDLPQVAPSAKARFADAGMAHRLTIHAGSFKTDPVPEGADVISLVRVLYDHADSTVIQLLQKCHDALPAGGRLIISEPMSGGDCPQRAGDAYFALYTMAMQTGKTRSAAEIIRICKQVGFTRIATPSSPRPFVTTCLIVQKD